MSNHSSFQGGDGKKVPKASSVKSPSNSSNGKICREPLSAFA